MVIRPGTREFISFSVTNPLGFMADFFHGFFPPIIQYYVNRSHCYTSYAKLLKKKKKHLGRLQT